MSQFTISLPCPDTTQPSMFDLTAAFQSLARIPNQLGTQIVNLRRQISEIEYSQLAAAAKQQAISAINAVIDPISTAISSVTSTIRNVLSIINIDGIGSIFDNPEYLIEKCVTALLNGFRMFGISNILNLIKNLVPLSVTISFAGFSIDLIQFGISSSYRAELRAQMAAQWDSFKNLIPDVFRTFQGKFGFDNLQQAVEAGWNWFTSEVYKFMTQTVVAGFELLISTFKSIWDGLNLPSIPDLLSIDIIGLIAGIINPIIASAKEIGREVYNALKNLSLFGFSILSIIGGELQTAYDNAEQAIDRLIQQARDFAVNWPWYVFTGWIKQIESFLRAIGLGSLLEWLQFTFCNFLSIIGVPTSISVNLPNTEINNATV